VLVGRVVVAWGYLTRTCLEVHFQNLEGGPVAHSQILEEGQVEILEEGPVAHFQILEEGQVVQFQNLEEEQGDHYQSLVGAHSRSEAADIMKR
jgi:hypothetical protein